MYDMTRVNTNGYFDEEDSEKIRFQKKEALSKQRTIDFKNGNYASAGALPDEIPDGAPQYLVDYILYYRRKRSYHPRSQGEGKGWNVTGCQSFLNMPILQYSNEIRSAVLMIHGEKAHSCYFSKDAYQKMMDGNPVPDNKELLIIPGAVHTDLYDQMDIIPFDKITDFYQTYLK